MAGALEMSWARFVAFELVAALLWSAVFMGLGVVFSSQIQQILDMMANAGVLAVLAIVLIVAALVARRWWRRRSFMHEMEMARMTVDDLYALMDTPQAPLVRSNLTRWRVLPSRPTTCPTRSSWSAMRWFAATMSG